MSSKSNKKKSSVNFIRVRSFPPEEIFSAEKASKNFKL